MSITIAGATDLLKDGSGNETLNLPTVASAVNYPALKASVTTSPVELDALGDDTHINLLLKPKGSGALVSAAAKTVLGGVAEGAVLTSTKLLKTVTAFTDTVAKAVFTVTVPIATVPVNAIIDLFVMGIAGAGGTIGAGEATSAVRYQVALARTTGKVVVPGVSSAVGASNVVVAGGNALTSVVVTLSAITGAAGADNTFEILVAVTKSGGASGNHVVVASAQLLNAYAGGATIA